MGNRIIKAVAFVLVVINFIPTPSFAAEGLSSRDDVMDFLENAFYAQVSLSEKKRDLKEVKTILIPYFTKDYQKLYLKENLIKENNKYLTYGSDFSAYSIPYFQFSNQTEVSIEKDKIYVYEFFYASNDGPVTYSDHYEGLLIEKINDDWKVSKLLQDEDIKSYLAEKKAIKSTSSQMVYWQQYLTTLVSYQDGVRFTAFNNVDLEKINHSIHFSGNSFQHQMPSLNPSLF
ncbi:MAG: DUF3993 domain-containing protein [Bacillus sp. (in: firmicutes)]